MELLPKPHEELDLPRDLPKELESGEPHHSAPPPNQGHANESSEEHAGYPTTLLSWKAPGRPYKKRGKQYFMTVILLMIFIEVILFLFSQYALMAVVASFVFLAFSFVLVPPRDFHYRISTQGVTVEDHSYLWQELYDFYFKRREGVDILMIGTHAYFPGELSITLGDVDRDHVMKVMIPYLPYRESVAPTFYEKSADWLVKTFPLEKPRE